MPKLSIDALQKITESTHVPAVGYAYVEPKEESKHEFTSTSLTVGKKKSTDEKTTVDADTRFPAASLSKIVFTYLVLQWVKENQINLDEPLHDIIKKKQTGLGKSLDHVLKYDRFVAKGEYPEQAKQITIRHILSHTTGLPNVGTDPSSTLAFISKPGEKYSYSGEGFIYLQKVIEATTGKNLEDLAQQYVFTPLKMDHSTFLPQPEGDPNIVAVHTHLGKPTSINESIPHLRYELELRSSLSDLSQAERGKIYLSENPREYYVKGMNGPAPIPLEIDLTNLTTKLNNLSFKSDILAMTSKAGHTPHLNAAGSLLTTADDFSKFMTAWLENMEPLIGCDLHLMSELPQSSTQYKNSYIFIKKNDTQELYYIKPDGEYEKIKIINFNLFEKKINDIKNKDETKLHLSEEQIKEIITSNGGHIRLQVLIQQAFKPTIAEAEEFKTCGLGWHLYRTKDTDELIAYQYGENTNMRSFVAINVNNKKGVAIFTNSEHGMSIGNQLLIGPIGNMQAVLKDLKYSQSDEPGWKEMLEGEIAEEQATDNDGFEKARGFFKKALELAPEGESKQRLEQRLAWFNEAHPTSQEKQAFTDPLLETFVGKYTNPHEEREIFLRDGSLIHKQLGHEIKLVRISKTDFVPEKNQSFRISVKEGQMSVLSIEGWKKSLDKQPKLEEEVTESIDSTQKMFQIMPPRPKSELKTIESQKQETSSNKLVQEVEERKEDKVQEEQKFNLTPFSTSDDPYKA
ncbi:putative secreted esterase [Legionella lansingensis]|uniref:Putative secreted esterase n=1 Tax=Legionella lansingensis TaxID=45067 RepID=A0A0W0VV44_9GAMM|nr:serine hydrolase domain-containing protein [Legionella lansingensis]KTD23902.1 putative secreted esterase [Legionella lansingensis]SNV46388.1 putative secreted esterase [Legionella lansingensis]